MSRATSGSSSTTRMFGAVYIYWPMDVLNPVTDKSMYLHRIRKSSLGTADSIRKRLGFSSPNDESFGWRMLVLSRVGYLLLLIAAVGTIVLAFRSADAEKWVQHSLDVRSQARE